VWGGQSSSPSSSLLLPLSSLSVLVTVSFANVVAVDAALVLTTHR
jgi:hypothetical protein